MKKFCFWVVLVLAASIFAIASANAAYVKKSDSMTAEIVSISLSGNKLTINVKFTNNASKAESFLTSFSIDVWQDGRKCDREKSSNTWEDIKDGASIDVTETYTLRNQTSLIEIDLDEWISWDNKPVVVYYNPQTNNWGSKNEASATPKPKSTETPKPVSTIVVGQDPVVQNEPVSSEWFCPNCGRKLDSKFCPDCGVPSPTPPPTPEPTPEPTPVPMNINNPVENVVKYNYTVIEDDQVYSGNYTGETIDGFPHGYGFFDCGDWIYYGDWSYGIRTENGNQIFIDSAFTMNKQSIKNKIDVKISTSIKGKKLKATYHIGLKDPKIELSDQSSDAISLNIMYEIYKDADYKELVTKGSYQVKLEKKKKYATKGNFYVELPADVDDKYINWAFSPDK